MRALFVFLLTLGFIGSAFSSSWVVHTNTDEMTDYQTFDISNYAYLPKSNMALVLSIDRTNNLLIRIDDKSFDLKKKAEQQQKTTQPKH